MIVYWPKSTVCSMPKNTDQQFYERADAVITLANEQMTTTDRGKVSASLMFATARFNSFVSACQASSSEDLAAGREEIIRYFVEQYQTMLTENLDDYIANFEEYTSPRD
ncbi:DUF3144 domain-containing protein [Lentisalinibacter salinarum]|uniref:DUF3144 domain-containing protein n=1 Tax=Lentisalinibacter salinarum TaxID=2992239 RepID=UPI0038646BD8